MWQHRFIAAQEKQQRTKHEHICIGLYAGRKFISPAKEKKYFVYLIVYGDNSLPCTTHVYTPDQNRQTYPWLVEASDLTSHAETSRNDTASPTRIALVVAIIAHPAIYFADRKITLQYLQEGFGQEKNLGPLSGIHVSVAMYGIAGHCPSSRRWIRFGSAHLHAHTGRAYGLRKISEDLPSVRVSIEPFFIAPRSTQVRS